MMNSDQNLHATEFLPYELDVLYIRILGQDYMGTFTRISVLNVAIVTDQFRVAFVDITVSRPHNTGEKYQTYGTVEVKFTHCDG